MTSVKTNKPVMAEMLVRLVLGDTESFEQLCAQRGVSVEEAIGQALKNWAGSSLPTVKPESLQLPTIGLLPDPADCPSGQEEHWIGVCEHDLNVLHREQRRCFRSQDRKGIARTTRTIETYIQTLAALKERVA